MEYALIWLVCAFIASAIGSRKGEAGLGFVIGAILGPLGVIFALASRGDSVPCPHCREPVRKKASICPHCRTPLTLKT